MVDYNYTRTITDGVRDIDNPKDVDVNGFPVKLYKRIKDALPGKSFKMVMAGTSVKISFDPALSSADKDTLDATIETHKSANGSPSKATIIPLFSADGTRYEFCVNNDGTLETMEA